MKHLFVLHGALGSAVDFRLLEEKLSPYLNVHLINFPGHGQEPFTDNFDIAGFGEFVIAYAEKKNINSFSVFGYSMGGFVGLWILSHRPELIDRVATLGTKFDWTEDFADAECKKLNPELIKEKVPLFADALNKKHGFGWEILVKKTAELLITLGKSNGFDNEQLIGINNPVMVLLGDLDHLVSVTESAKVAALLKNGCFKTISETPHLVEKVDVNRLADELVSFFVPQFS